MLTVQREATIGMAMPGCVWLGPLAMHTQHPGKAPHWSQRRCPHKIPGVGQTGPMAASSFTPCCSSPQSLTLYGHQPPEVSSSAPVPGVAQLSGSVWAQGGPHCREHKTRSQGSDVCVSLARTSRLDTGFLISNTFTFLTLFWGTHGETDNV